MSPDIPTEVKGRHVKNFTSTDTARENLDIGCLKISNTENNILYGWILMMLPEHTWVNIRSTCYFLKKKKEGKSNTN